MKIASLLQHQPYPRSASPANGGQTVRSGSPSNENEPSPASSGSNHGHALQIGARNAAIAQRRTFDRRLQDGHGRVAAPPGNEFGNPPHAHVAGNKPAIPAWFAPFNNPAPRETPATREWTRRAFREHFIGQVGSGKRKSALRHLAKFLESDNRGTLADVLIGGGCKDENAKAWLALPNGKNPYVFRKDVEIVRPDNTGAVALETLAEEYSDRPIPRMPNSVVEALSTLVISNGVIKDVLTNSQYTAVASRFGAWLAANGYGTLQTVLNDAGSDHVNQIVREWLHRPDKILGDREFGPSALKALFKFFGQPVPTELSKWTSAGYQETQGRAPGVGSSVSG